jgi:hypothetical protein
LALSRQSGRWRYFSLATGIYPFGLLTAGIDGLKSAVADKSSVETAIGTPGQFLKDAKVFEKNNSVSSVFLNSR